MIRRLISILCSIFLVSSLTPLCYAQDNAGQFETDTLLDHEKSVAECAAQRDKALETARPGEDYVDGELSISFKDVSIEELHAFIDTSGFELIDVLSWSNESSAGYLKDAAIRAPEGMDMREAVATAESYDAVELANPNWLYVADGHSPLNPSFSFYDNGDQSYPPSPEEFKAIRERIELLTKSAMPWEEVVADDVYGRDARIEPIPLENEYGYIGDHVYLLLTVTSRDELVSFIEKTGFVPVNGVDSVTIGNKGCDFYAYNPAGMDIVEACTLALSFDEVYTVQLDLENQAFREPFVRIVSARCLNEDFDVEKTRIEDQGLRLFTYMDSDVRDGYIDLQIQYPEDMTYEEAATLVAGVDVLCDLGEATIYVLDSEGNARSESSGGTYYPASYSDPQDYYIENQWYLPRMGVPTAWDISQSAGEVTVAVLDTGVDFNHSDLVNNLDMEHAWDVVAGGELTGDVQGHGTRVAGIIAGQANNGIGIAGVSYNARIVPIRVASNTGDISELSVNSLKSALDYIASSNIPNLKVINCSFSGSVSDNNVAQRIVNLRNQGVVFVASAGNTNSTEARYPSDYPQVISVIATNQIDERYSSSSYGAFKNVCAPGASIKTTTSGNSAYGTYSGTSYAAPMVSGVLALMFAADPSLTPDQAQSILQSTATDLGAEGFDTEYAYGLVNATAALEAVVDTNARISIAGADVSGLEAPANHLRNGVAAPQVSVTLNGTQLVENTDYRVIYANNTTSGGIAEITIKGVGSYCGAISKSLIVLPWWQRIAGEDMVQTAVASSRYGWADDSCDAVIVVHPEAWRDSAVASGLAGLVDCPILYTDPNDGSIPADTVTEIERLGASKVYVVGGTYWIPQTSITQLQNIFGVGQVSRLAGDYAWETAVEVYDEGASLGGWGGTCLVVPVGTFEDAITVGPYAYALNAPIFMNDGDKHFDSSTLAAISNGGFNSVIVASGTYWIPDEDYNQLPSTRQRVCGDWATQTARIFANWAASHGMNRGHIGIATSERPYDALIAGPLQGKLGSPLLLARRDDNSDATSYVTTYKAQIVQGYIYGGTYWFPNEVVADFEDILES